MAAASFEGSGQSSTVTAPITPSVMRTMAGRVGESMPVGNEGGGVVEACPQDTGGKNTSASFLYSATRSLFEQAGFRYDRPKGKNHCVMSKSVAPA